MMNTKLHLANEQAWTNETVKRMSRKVDQLLLGDDKVGEDNHGGGTRAGATTITREMPPPLVDRETEENHRDTIKDIDLDEISRASMARSFH